MDHNKQQDNENNKQRNKDNNKDQLDQSVILDTESQSVSDTFNIPKYFCTYCSMKCHSTCLPLVGHINQTTNCDSCYRTICIICKQPHMLFQPTESQCSLQSAINHNRIKLITNLLLTLILILLLPLTSFLILLSATLQALENYTLNERTFKLLIYLPLILLASVWIMPQTLCKIIHLLCIAVSNGEWMRFPTI